MRDFLVGCGAAGASAAAATR
ncbi:twin-arginine translocation signal domain-containing protein [Novosphingobium sp. NPDC080210]